MNGRVAVAAFAASLMAVSARADHAFGRKDLKDGVWRTDGVPAGTYYVRYEVAEGAGRGLTLDGRPVDFTHAGPWETRGGHERAVLESEAIEIRPGQVFRPGENASRESLVLAEKPLAFARPPETFQTIWGVDAVNATRVDKVLTSAWRNADGRQLVMFLNTVNEPQEVVPTWDRGGKSFAVCREGANRPRPSRRPSPRRRKASASRPTASSSESSTTAAARWRAASRRRWPVRRRSCARAAAA